MIDIDKLVAKQPAQAPRQGLPVLPPVAALLEILVLLVLPASLDYFWTGFPSLTETQPHYFWLPVLLLSLQYGTVSGLLTAGVAIALTSVLGWPDQDVGENHFSYLLRAWAQPVLWLAAAFVLGQFRMRQIEYKLQLAQQVTELSGQRSAIADYATNLRARCESLEREIACRRSPSARAVLDAMSETRSGRIDVSAALSSCLDVAFGPCRGTLYAKSFDGLHCVARHGGTPDDSGIHPFYPPAHPITQLVGDEGRALSALVPGDEAHLHGDGIVVVPVLSGLDGRIVGALKLDAIEPAELDFGTSGRLSIIANQLAPLILAQVASPAPRPAFDGSHPTGKAGSKLRLWRQVKWRRLRHQDMLVTHRSSRVG